MTKKSLSIFLLFVFLASPLEAAFAFEGPEEPTIPIYFFADQYGGILGIVPVTDTEKAYQNNGAARFLLDHSYVPALVGAAPLVIYGGGAAVLGGGSAAIPAAESAATKLCEKYCPQGQKLLNPGINNIAGRIGHVISRHGYGTAQSNVSVFNASEDIAGLVKSGTQQIMRLQPNSNYVRVFDVGRNIGIDRATGGQTSIMSIVTNQYNNFVTAFPGFPSY